MAIDVDALPLVLAGPILRREGDLKVDAKGARNIAAATAIQLQLGARLLGPKRVVESLTPGDLQASYVNQRAKESWAGARSCSVRWSCAAE